MVPLLNIMNMFAFPQLLFFSMVVESIRLWLRLLKVADSFANFISYSRMEASCSVLCVLFCLVADLL